MKQTNCKTLLTVMLATGLCCFAAKAQEQAQSAMTLHDCMEYALSNSTKMRLQAADRSDEQLERRQAIMQAFTPSMSASTYAYDNFGRNLDPETNTYNTVTSFHNGYSLSAGITIFDGFRAINNIKMMSVSSKIGISKEQQERDQICLATMEAFANVIYYSEMEKVVSDQVETARYSRNRAVRQEELGQKGHADVVQMESELAQKEYMLINTVNQKNDAMITLKDVMFWPAEEELVLDTNIPDPVKHDVNVADLASNAMSFMPSAKIASLNIKNADLDLKIARSAYSPSLSLYGGWSTSYYTYPGEPGYVATPYRHQLSNNAGEYIQMSLNIPLYNQMQRHTQLKKKKNALSRAQIQYDQTMRDIENEVRRAVNDRDGAQAAFHQAERLADVQQEAYQLSTKQFETGLISAIEYQTASQTYLNAMAERMNSLLQFKIKDAVVRYYNGEAYINQ